MFRARIKNTCGYSSRISKRVPRLSLILLDWGVRESLHVLHYLQQQTVPRDGIEVVLVEYYDTVSKPAAEFESRIDTWALLEMPSDCYYHKHLMYNAGTVLSRGEILMFADSDTMVRPTFVETVFKAFDRDPSSFTTWMSFVTYGAFYPLQLSFLRGGRG